jgi:Amt family ammonium transporter
VAATFSKGVVLPELIFVPFQGCLRRHHLPALIVGAFAERIKFSAVLIFMVLWFTFSYMPMAHMVWYWAGPDAFTERRDAGQAGGQFAGWLWATRARSTSPAARWCTSTPAWPAWSVPT